MMLQLSQLTLTLTQHRVLTMRKLKCEEAMREVLGAGRGVQAGEVEIPAMAAEAGRETRQGAASDEESDGCDGAQDCNTT